MNNGINSDLFQAENYMQPRLSPWKITVFTESDEDIAFWRRILDDFEKPTLQFEILPASRDSNDKGKDKALSKLQEGVGPFMIVCVDSDYDYFLQCATPNSAKINSSPYIFQTYVYSIENYLCHAETLHSVCTTASKSDSRDTDFEKIMREFSQIIYDLLIFSVWLAKKQSRKIFPVSDFSENVSFSGPFDPNNKEKWIEILSRQIADKQQDVCTKIRDNFFLGMPEKLENEISAFKQEMEVLGFRQNNAYLFLKGHILRNNFVDHIVKYICEKRKKEKIDAIRANGNNVQNSIKEYTNSCCPVKTAMDANVGYKVKC